MTLLVQRWMHHASPWTLVISGWPGPCLYSQNWPTSTPTTPGPLSTLTPSLGSSSSRWWTLKRESAEKVYERVGLLHKFYISGVHLHSTSSPRLNLEYTLSCFPHKDLYLNLYSTFTHPLSILGHFWANLGNFGSLFGPFFGANFLWQNIALC